MDSAEIAVAMVISSADATHNDLVVHELEPSDQDKACTGTSQKFSYELQTPKFRNRKKSP